MRTQTARDVSPQKKILGISSKFNNPGIKKQQGTTRVIYDSLPADGRTQFRFFEESNNRNFPFTNMGSDGNKLPVGNAMVIERAYLTVVETVAAQIATIQTLDSAGFTAARLGELNIEIANSQVLKNVPTLSWEPQYNKNACNINYNNFEFDTQIVIQPLLEFVFTLKTDSYVALVDTYLRLTVEGVGAIIAPRTTM